jgi:hypothetical protein
MKKLKRRQEMKEKQEDQKKRAQVKKMKVTNLTTYNLSIQLLKPSLRIFLEAIFAKCLTFPNSLEKPHQSLEVFDLAILSIHTKSTED